MHDRARVGISCLGGCGYDPSACAARDAHGRGLVCGQRRCRICDVDHHDDGDDAAVSGAYDPHVHDTMQT